MEQNQVLLLYEGDAWLSQRSLHLCAIFTTEEDLERYTQDMKAKGVIDQDNKDRLFNGYRQCSGIGKWSECRFMVETYDLNQTEYDG